MEQTDTEEMEPGGKASYVALAGTIAFVIGVILTPLLGLFGFFFIALGGFAVLVSPFLWVLLVWDDGLDQ